MKIFAIVAAAAFAATGAAAQVSSTTNPAVTGSIGATTGAPGTSVPGVGTSPTASGATSPARGDRARTGRDALNPAPTVDTTTTAVPPIAGSRATPGTSVNGDGNATTPGTSGTAATTPGTSGTAAKTPDVPR